jgi:hypothetical protein
MQRLFVAFMLEFAPRPDGEALSGMVRGPLFWAVCSGPIRSFRCPVSLRGNRIAFDIFSGVIADFHFVVA